MPDCQPCQSRIRASRTTSLAEFSRSRVSSGAPCGVSVVAEALELHVAAPKITAGHQCSAHVATLPSHPDLDTVATSGRSRPGAETGIRRCLGGTILQHHGLM